MRYLPHTGEDISRMLAAIGLDSLEALFAQIPAECRHTEDLKLPEALTEWELEERMNALSSTVAVAPEYRLWLGAGSYDHYIPASVSHLLSRSEFVTSYTPYQPEISQGTLQGIFEYQTLVARLLGMEVANASIYDGASAMAEALLMTIRITGRKRIAVSSAVHPHYRRVLETYFKPSGHEIILLPVLENGTTDLSPIDSLDGLAGVAVQSPNFFGCIEDLKQAAETAHSKGALSVSVFTEPLAYGLLKSPGSQGADISCGEGQSLGIPRSLGGPALGLFASRRNYVRSMPGRLVGQTVDREGKRGFVLTLATREQHIRREKATSNICTNNSLCAMAAAMYMASVGGTGFRELARLNYDKCAYLKAALRNAGFEIPFETPTFNEFVTAIPPKVYRRLLKKKTVAGLPLGPYYPKRRFSDKYLLCVTETASKEAMDDLIKELSS
ncbi:MAG: aminomethyl-transferring glycine dehydrogenase subunit GcvPA [Desulfobacteraceae bacterium]|nr:MAG: aminomethyl-transferring glycine dehydrogenase subunit GcvPA [Desulfobacteraceae bacterium]